MTEGIDFTKYNQRFVIECSPSTPATVMAGLAVHT